MFGGRHRHCSNGDMFSVVDEQDSTSSLKSISLLFIFESTEYVMLISATIEETQIIFASLSRNTVKI